jgi:hypothetical protein
MAQRWKHRPEGSSWGEFGPDGVLNPRRGPPRLAPTLRNGKANFCFALGDEAPLLTDAVCDDVVLLALQYSTQWDSFAHVGSRFDADGDGVAERVFYNGFGAGDFTVPAEHPGAEPWARFEARAPRPSGSRTSPSTAPRAAAS